MSVPARCTICGQVVGADLDDQNGYVLIEHNTQSGRRCRGSGERAHDLQAIPANAIEIPVRGGRHGKV